MFFFKKKTCFQSTSTPVRTDTWLVNKNKYNKNPLRALYSKYGFCIFLHVTKTSWVIGGDSIKTLRFAWCVTRVRCKTNRVAHVSAEFRERVFYYHYCYVLVWAARLLARIYGEHPLRYANHNKIRNLSRNPGR